MKFPDDRMTITQVIPHLWQGAMPMPGSDMAEYGVGVRVYLLLANRVLRVRDDWRPAGRVARASRRP